MRIVTIVAVSTLVLALSACAYVEPIGRFVADKGRDAALAIARACDLNLALVGDGAVTFAADGSIVRKGTTPRAQLGVACRAASDSALTPLEYYEGPDRPAE